MCDEGEIADRADAVRTESQKMESRAGETALDGSARSIIVLIVVGMLVGVLSGTFGIARTLMYKGEQGEPLYSVLPDGTVSEGKEDTEPSFFQEYHVKLKNIYSRFYTRRGEEIAYSRKSVVETFYRAMLAEARAAYAGKFLLDQNLNEKEEK